MTITHEIYANISAGRTYAAPGGHTLTREGDFFLLSSKTHGFVSLYAPSTPVERLDAHWNGFVGFTGASPDKIKDVTPRSYKALRLSYDEDSATYFVNRFAWHASLAAASGEGELIDHKDNTPYQLRADEQKQVDWWFEQFGG
jgi:hypothetical protein